MILRVKMYISKNKNMLSVIDLNFRRDQFNLWLKNINFFKKLF